MYSLFYRQKLNQNFFNVSENHNVSEKFWFPKHSENPQL